MPTEKQEKMIEKVKQWIIEDRNNKRKEVKEFEVDHMSRISFLTLELGLPGDEGTAASIFCRDRFMVSVGRRGSLHSYNGRAWVKF